MHNAYASAHDVAEDYVGPEFHSGEVCADGETTDLTERIPAREGKSRVHVRAARENGEAVKIPFSLKFNEVVDCERFDGQQMTHLPPNSSESSWQSAEVLVSSHTTALYSGLPVPLSHTTVVSLWLVIPTAWGKTTASLVSATSAMRNCSKRHTLCAPRWCTILPPAHSCTEGRDFANLQVRLCVTHFYKVCHGCLDALPHLGGDLLGIMLTPACRADALSVTLPCLRGGRKGHACKSRCATWLGRDLSVLELSGCNHISTRVEDHEA